MGRVPKSTICVLAAALAVAMVFSGDASAKNNGKGQGIGKIDGAKQATSLMRAEKRNKKGLGAARKGLRNQGSTGSLFGGLPPGLGKRDQLPPGLAKKANLPPGLRKFHRDPPGLAKKNKLPPGLDN